METVEGKKKVLTDEERIQLADKLDKDLDDYINSLEKKSYSEGWPEDRWQEEFEKHPFFMTKSPEEGDELSPLMEGIQKLKYDSAENTPEELAATYKEDGNFNFKCKKYRLAVLGYTEGLKQKCSDDDLNAQLHNNRAAANFFLKNYRTCLADCMIALKLKPNYTKAQIRAAQCYHILGKYDEALKFCDQVLTEDSKNEIIQEIKSDSLNKKKLADRDKRKQAILEKKAKEEEEKLLLTVQERKLKFLRKGRIESGVKSIAELKPTFSGTELRPVHLLDGRLVWPVVFLYPEYKTTDFVEEFHEDTTFLEQFHTMFDEPCDWDVEKKYVPEKLAIYFEDFDDSDPYSVSLNSTLGAALKSVRYYIDGGTPTFIVLVSGSKAEEIFFRGIS